MKIILYVLEFQKHCTEQEKIMVYKIRPPFPGLLLLFWFWNLITPDQGDCGNSKTVQNSALFLTKLNILKQVLNAMCTGFAYRAKYIMLFLFALLFLYTITDDENPSNSMSEFDHVYCVFLKLR